MSDSILKLIKDALKKPSHKNPKGLTFKKVQEFCKLLGNNKNDSRK